jgi:hypothetical protein
MMLTNDYLEVGIMSELYDVDHDDFKDKLRRVNPSFSDHPDFKQDVQMIFDENLLNHVLLALYTETKIYSLRDLITSMIPPKYQTYVILA